MSPGRMIRKLNVFNLVFFGSLLFITLTALPCYAVRVGVSRSEWLLFFGYVIATGLSVTVGYHRLFAHRSFQASRLVTFLSLLFGAAAFEQSALLWSSQHRDHHLYVDTERDPYNIKRGFWYAHVGWILFWRHETDYSNVKDLAEDRLILHQHRYYPVWAITAGIVLPLAIGAATGHFMGAVLLGVVGRLTLVHHSTWSINSICHTFGKATYDIDATARDHWLVAFLTNGEGYHNFHHRFASDYRNGVRWYQWDPSKWTIALLHGCGLASKLHRVRPHAILAARVAAEHQRVERELGRQRHPSGTALLETVRQRYAALKNALEEWGRVEEEFRRLRKATVETSRTYLHSMRRQVAQRRLAFVEARRQWVALINANPLIPRAAHI
ncbi:MAG: fatty acid desaturase [Candidatus Omnitrophica bacterium]|nr:fatty acid desaturase [Candidatus Omnitrophota bacterium]